jgi:hypothetical protein
MGLSFRMAAGPRQCSHSHLWVLRDSSPYIIVTDLRRDSWPDITVTDSRRPSNLEGQVPVFISPRNRLAQLYPEALGSIFITSYNSQGYVGGIQTCFHTDFLAGYHHTTLSDLIRFCTAYIVSRQIHRKHCFVCQECVFIGWLPNSGCFLLSCIVVCITQQWALYQESVSTEMCLLSRCLAVGRYITVCYMNTWTSFMQQVMKTSALF